MLEIHPDNRGPQLILSRTAPAMLVELFEVGAEIAEDIIQIRGALVIGFRAKIAVQTNDGRIDPVGACVVCGVLECRPLQVNWQASASTLVLGTTIRPN